MENTIAFILGVLAAGVGGELFVRGSIRLAAWARIPPGIIGATIAAFATSSPECTVAVSAALASTPVLALGDALGSNVVNVALILALALLMASICAPRDSLTRDFPVAMLVPILLAVLAFDGTLSRRDGVLLLVIFCTWLTATVLEVRRQRSAVDQVLGEPRRWRALVSEPDWPGAPDHGRPADRDRRHGHRPRLWPAGVCHWCDRRRRGHVDPGTGHHSDRPGARPCRDGPRNGLGEQYFQRLVDRWARCHRLPHPRGLAGPGRRARFRGHHGRPGLPRA